MKKLNIVPFCALLSLVSCSLEQITDDSAVSVRAMRFTASIENTLTKTQISGDKNFPEMIWNENDEIGIGVYGNNFQSFINVAGDNSTGLFEGSITSSEDYYAVYPYMNSLISSNLAVDIPRIQTYSEGSFAKDAFPMVAKFKQSEAICFQNLCGVLEVRLTGTETVISIVFNGISEDGTDVPVSGKGNVKWNYVTAPILVMDSASSNNKVILDCGKGVTLKQDNPTSFYIVLPPTKFSQAEIRVVTKEGNFMSKVSNNAFEIKRSVITRISPIPLVTEPLDYSELSLFGTSNCYIISDAGDYSFDATVAGNGEFGIIEGMPMFASSPYINPVSAELLWEDHSGMIAGVSCAEGKIRFISTGIEGNALIAVKDADGKILWSWHIWCTDKPVDHLYKNSYGEFTMMDRNLGATRADHGIGDEWHESCGLCYQWGRKDPFAGGLFTSSSESSEIEFSVENPSIKMSYWNSDSRYWSPSSKSIYDPCPAGYVVCSMDAFRGLSIGKVSGSFENGWNFIYDDVNSAWYPCKANAEESGTSYWGESYMWSSTYSSGLFYIYFSYVSFSLYGSASDLNPLRCMRQGDIK